MPSLVSILNISIRSWSFCIYLTAHLLQVSFVLKLHTEWTFSINLYCEFKFFNFLFVIPIQIGSLGSYLNIIRFAADNELFLVLPVRKERRKPIGAKLCKAVALCHLSALLIRICRVQLTIFSNRLTS